MAAAGGLGEGAGSPVVARLARRALVLAGSIALLVLLRGVVSDEAERPLVEALNPAAAPRALDLFVVALTDFSIALFSVVFVAWALGWAALRQQRVERGRLGRLFPWLGLGIGAAAAVVLVPAYELRLAPLTLVPASLAGFALAGASLARLPRARLDAIGSAFFAALLAIALSELAIELVERLTAERVRPLGVENLRWGQWLRIIADERVRSGTSYVSGHAAGFFALVMPLGAVVRSRTLRWALLGWAALHAASRLYVAAHFPSDVLLGSALGIAIGLLALATVRDLRGARAAAAMPS